MVSFPTEPNERFKEFAYEQVARIGKALSSPQRLVLLNILCQGRHTVESLAKHSGLTVANASQHLQTLKAANLVEVERQGNYMQYWVGDERVRSFYFSLQDLALHSLAELRQALAEISSSPTRLEAVDHRELMTKVTNREAVAIDVRPASEYDEGHLPGAVSLPLEDLEQRLAELPAEGEIVALCRGRYCILADKAVSILRNHGFAARRATDGVGDWERAGQELEK